jgi:hypothetical protein
MTVQHPEKCFYLSTACNHEARDGDPAMHASCRQTCKWCGASCRCSRHPAQDNADLPPHWVDQARGAALRLLGHLEAAGVDLASVDPHLARALREDPRFFWARGEEAPPGVWQPPGEEQ